MNRQGRIPFAAIIHQDIHLSLLSHCFLRQLGGLGSHVVQQAAYLGVRRFILVDHDIVTLTNLNRLIGTCELDVQRQELKVVVAERQIRFVQPSAEILSLGVKLQKDEVERHLSAADVVFGCIDNDSARLRISEVASRNRKRYIDLATDTGSDNGQVWYGGRVFFSHCGGGCLVCAGELDQHAIARESMTPEQKAEDNAIYGVPREALSLSGPAVVSINGVVASFGVTEFMVWATGLRAPKPHIRYRGDLGKVTFPSDRPTDNCYYCTMFGQ